MSENLKFNISIISSISCYYNMISPWPDHHVSLLMKKHQILFFSARKLIGTVKFWVFFSKTINNINVMGVCMMYYFREGI